ncbi:MAG: hypothetical protein R3F50_19705 [Gammaproteobacteria bacterium]|jgi:Asp-tRNA(Asn)/Glu-tRNA(Gln) amidotransferase C subunit
MSCPNTRYLLTEYFDESQPSLAREELERHLDGCQQCSEELGRLQEALSTLDHWQEQRVPHWDRGAPLYLAEHRPESAGRINSGAWLTQWLPTAASFAMLVLLLFNGSVVMNEGGFRIEFGAVAPGLSQVQLDQQLLQFAEQQQQRQDASMQLYMTRLDERQDSNNLRLMRTVLEQAREISAENFDQIYTYFDQQRQLDMETVQVSYQQLLDSDFETLRTIQQLASAAQYQDGSR